MAFTLATWNINSVRLRENIVSRLMSEEMPDILCLQECKCLAEQIPTEAFEKLGYRYRVARGQKSYNGVAILSKLPMVEAAGRLACSHCDRELPGRVIYQLIEFHEHPR